MGADARADDMRRFIGGRAGLEAVVQRIGLETWDLILVDADGAWDRWVFHTQADARTAAEAAGAAVHEGWTDELSQRVTHRDEWRTPGGTRRAL
jgi:hypothetical protein